MRRIARTQQRKRQTWLALPASGIEEVGHGLGRTEVGGESHEATPHNMLCVLFSRIALHKHSKPDQARL